MRDEAPFLSHLTVFKSRLGNLNLVLQLSSLGYQPGQTLERRLRELLANRKTVRSNSPEFPTVIDYLLDKNLVSANHRASGRYRSYRVLPDKRTIMLGDVAVSEIEVFETDYWMAMPEIRSTIGAPTAENIPEILELAYQLRIVSRTRNNWTVAGQAANGIHSVYDKETKNPYLLGAESAVFLRQILAEDGPLFSELVRQLNDGPKSFKKQDAIRLFPGCVKVVVSRVHAASSYTPPEKTAAKTFLKLIDRSASKAGEGKAAGVLDHRVSPRLEWLSDLGTLAKRGQRNSFEYETTCDLPILAEHLRTGEPTATYWPEDTALAFWRTSHRFAPYRNQASQPTVRAALAAGYALVQRSIAPTSIRDVCFCAGLLSPNQSYSMKQYYDELIVWALADRSIGVSGGRYSRNPELVHMSRK